MNIIGIIENTIPEIFGAIIGAGSAILVFYKETRRDRVEDDKKRQEENIEKTKYLGCLLNSVIEFGKKQSLYIKEYKEAVEENPLELPYMSLIPLQDFKRLEKLFDSDNYYHAFLGVYGSGIERVNQYKTISAKTDYVINVFDQLVPVTSKARELDYERKSSCNELYKDIYQKVARLNIDESIKSSIEHKIYSKILGDYSIQVNELGKVPTIEFVQKEFVEILQKRLTEETDFKNNADTIHILQLLQKLKTMITDIKTQNIFHAQGFSSIYEGLDAELLKLKEIGKELIEVYLEKEKI